MPRRGRHRFIALTKRLQQIHPAIVQPDELIEEGVVLVNGVIVTNPAALVPVDASVRLRRPHEPRGRAKLTAALQAFQVPTAGRLAVDLGASAGGFTLALLDAGVTRVYAIDAGHGQLLGRLRADPRVINLEGSNIGDLRRGDIPEVVEVIVVDLSYLPLARAAPQLEVLDIADGAHVVALVKPMYELGLHAPPSEESAIQKAVELASAAMQEHGWHLCGTMPSPVTGARGAIEHLIHLRRGRP
jgi:23S rRNA (cytidine1920-2'-O)/16S rRNA (cytidine1409-2'-O)-methyltransferase